MYFISVMNIMKLMHFISDMYYINLMYLSMPCILILSRILSVGCNFFSVIYYVGLV